MVGYSPHPSDLAYSSVLLSNSKQKHSIEHNRASNVTNGRFVVLSLLMTLVQDATAGIASAPKEKLSVIMRLQP